jgi:hypothetical protein
MTSAWPDGVIARARTFGGGVIDITSTTGSATAACTGCGESTTHTAKIGYQPRTRQELVYADELTEEAQQKAILWVRNHATCPFMPRLEGTR